MDTLTVLKSVNGQSLAKKYFADVDGFRHVDFVIPKIFNIERTEVRDLASLGEAISELEAQPTKAVIRGKLKDGYSDRNQVRQTASATASFIPKPRKWLCIDLDELPLPNEFADFNEHLDAVARHAADKLPPEFRGVDFFWQFSGSMGIKPGIRIHLWYWLSRPVSDVEAKAWLSSAETKVDRSLYSPEHLHYTSSPIIEPADADPVQQRSGYCEFGNAIAEVPVPPDLGERAEAHIRTRRKNKLSADGTRLEDSRIVRNEDGTVIDGREQFIFYKSLDACAELTRGQDLAQNVPTVDQIADLT